MNQLGWLPGYSKECYGFRGPPFPEKLYAAMDAPNAVIKWTNNGRAICIDAEDYEQNVMHVHPGLMEISSFANFRRQMREYGFDWTYQPETREFEFSHPSFLRGRPDLLTDVLTRRKRRRKHGVASYVGTHLRGTSLPRRRSVISYAGVPKRDSDWTRTGRASATLQTPSDDGTARWLNEMPADEWWTYCAPAIMMGMNHVEDDAVTGRYPSVKNTFISPLFFYSDETREDTDKAVNRLTDRRWTHRVLDFDEL